MRLTVPAGGLDLADVAPGDSIAIQGACMTVIDRSDTAFDVDVSRESLNRTVGLAHPGEVNLEKALRAHRPAGSIGRTANDAHGSCGRAKMRRQRSRYRNARRAA